MTELSELERVRLEKLEDLRGRGIDPFPRRIQRTHQSMDAIEAYEAVEEAGEEVAAIVAGRIRSMRHMGKISFAHLEDGKGKLQLFFRKDEIGDEQFRLLLDTFDLGDFIQADGVMFRTKTGEVTLRVKTFQMVAKALSPLPAAKEEQAGDQRIVHSAFSDPEARYRQRYADLAVNPEVRDTFRVRARIIRSLQQFLDAKGFLEVETPILQPIYGGAAAKPFVTHHNQLHQDLYLRISFELYLKRLIVYIHRNPQAHGFVDNFRDWPYSSYWQFLREKAGFLSSDLISDLFGGEENYRESHERLDDIKGFENASSKLLHY